MRKLGYSVLCCVAAAAFLSGCNKNEDKCCGSCQDKAAVKMETGATPAADANCASKCATQCSGDKAAVKVEAGAVPASDSSCATKKAAGACCKSKQAQ